MASDLERLAREQQELLAQIMRVLCVGMNGSDPKQTVDEIWRLFDSGRQREIAALSRKTLGNVRSIFDPIDLKKKPPMPSVVRRIDARKTS